MPIWVPILVLAAALLLVAPAGDYLGLDPIVCVAFSSVTAVGATAVLVLGWLLPSLAPTHPRQTAWLLLVTPIVVAALTVWPTPPSTTATPRPRTRRNLPTLWRTTVRRPHRAPVLRRRHRLPMPTAVPTTGQPPPPTPARRRRPPPTRP
jgi:hypothetical protein